MTDLHPDLPHFATNQPVVFGWLPNQNLAELALAELLSLGVSPQNVTLVEPQQGRPFEDSLAPAVVPMSGTRRAGASESSVGGGIATDDFDDDVSSVEEMDDSQSASEELIYPASGHSYSHEEALDLHRSVEGASNLRPCRPRPEFNLTEINLPGLGRVAGEGSFGTHLIEARFVGGLGAVRRWLWGESTPGIEGDTCVLAIDATVEGPDVDTIETVLVARGARFTRRTGG